MPVSALVVKVKMSAFMGSISNSAWHIIDTQLMLAIYSCYKYLLNNHYVPGTVSAMLRYRREKDSVLFEPVY